MGDYPAQQGFPRVSILAPARNEEQNIGPCVESLLAQRYPNYEVIVLNDDSSDRTGEILAQFAVAGDRLRVVNGTPLPPGWLGKNWACHQLAQVADGELLLFVDADTRHSESMLEHAVAALEAEQADLLSAIPREEVVTWAERLVVPIIPVERLLVSARVRRQPRTVALAIGGHRTVHAISTHGLRAGGRARCRAHQRGGRPLAGATHQSRRVALATGRRHGQHELSYVPQCRRGSAWREPDALRRFREQDRYPSICMALAGRGVCRAARRLVGPLGFVSRFAHFTLAGGRRGPDLSWHLDHCVSRVSASRATWLWRIRSAFSSPPQSQSARPS